MNPINVQSSYDSPVNETKLEILNIQEFCNVVSTAKHGDCCLSEVQAF
jgi:hypothetical protein